MSKATQKTSLQRQFNPVKAKLAYLEECFGQLQKGLPTNKKEYIAADRLTHSYIKSCFLMIVQRAVDINNAIIEFSGKTPPYQKFQGFRAVQESGAIDEDTLNFFEHALVCYQKIANPYEGVSPAELYDVSSQLLENGKTYTLQIKNFFQDSDSTLANE